MELRVGKKGSGGFEIQIEEKDVISLCLPSRNRPEGIARMICSAYETALRLPEIVCYVDKDEPQLSAYLSYSNRTYGIRLLVGDRLTMSDYWNKCAVAAKGDILMLCADDIVFRSEGWDLRVEKAFNSVPDRIAMVYGDDGQPGTANHATHPFVHRRWFETLGYFTPPYFVSDYADAWINDLATGVGRRVYLSEVKTEHMHFSLGKSGIDETYRDRFARHAESNPAKLYADLLPERLKDIEKLKGAMQ